MVIGIWNPDAQWCREAARSAEALGMEIGEPVAAFCFQEAQQVLAFQGEPLELLFVHLAGDCQEGIALARQMNQRRSQCQIAYVGSSMDCVRHIYHTQHCFFLPESEYASRLGEVLGKVLRSRQAGKSCLLNLKGGGQLRIGPGDIQYFERDLRRTLLYTPWGSYVLKDKLEQLRQALPEVMLVRCHNSYLVNLEYVRELHREAMVLRSGQVLPVSRGSREAVARAFARWRVTAAGFGP